jgi:hypothetical protein
LPILVFAALLAVTATACTSTAQGNPVAGPTSANDQAPSGSPTSSDEPTKDTLPSDGAPKVAAPVDASYFEQNPCDVLTADQAKELDVDVRGERSDTNFGAGCSWQSARSNGNTSIDFMSDDKRGLSSTYRSHGKGEFAFFEPLADIEGHPAVALNPDDDDPKATCAIVVGLTDELAVMNITNLSSGNVGQKDPCAVAATATTLMVRTIKAGR